MSTMKVINPATNEILREIPEDTLDTIKNKFEGCAVAQKSWANDIKYEDRAKIIAQFVQLLQEKQEDLAQILTAETGKPIEQSRGEISIIPSRVQWCLENTKAAMQTQEFEGSKHRVEYEAKGVIGFICAWNFPYLMAVDNIVPAVLCGNSVMFKPSEYSLLCGLELQKLFDLAGLPKGVLEIVAGGAAVGNGLITLPELASVLFIGSHFVGVKIAEATAKQLKKVTLELGGKDPFYIHHDVDLDSHLDVLVGGKFDHAGQSCNAIERIYVHPQIYEEFLTRYSEAVSSKLTVGNPTENTTQIGPLCRGKTHVEELENLVADALAKGAKLACGSGKGHTIGSGFYFAPTVLRDVTHDMLISKKDCFGPLVGVQCIDPKVTSSEQTLIEEVVKLMNDSHYGLTAGVFSTSSDFAQKVLRRVNTGTVYWNSCGAVEQFLPWGGRQCSGLGIILSVDGIRQNFLNHKSWFMGF